MYFYLGHAYQQMINLDYSFPIICFVTHSNKHKNILRTTILSWLHCLYYRKISYITKTFLSVLGVDSGPHKCHPSAISLSYTPMLTFIEVLFSTKELP